MNKEFIRMQKLAGLMTEGLYTSDEKAPTEGMSHDGESRMTKKKLKEKIKGMMNQEGYMGTPYDSSDDMALDMIKTGAGLPGGNMEEYDTQGLTNAASVVDHYLKTAYDAGSTGVGFDDNLAYELMDHLKQFSGEMGSMEENASDIPSSVSKSSVELLVAAAKRVVGALRDSGFEQEDIYDYIMDKIKTLSVDEALFEAKKDEEESDTEDVIVAEPGDGEVPAEDVAVDAADTNTQVDVNMDGVPDVDTGSAESKKAFTSLVDTYNSAKELGDPKLTQMIANALTYYNKNIILKSGQPQA